MAGKTIPERYEPRLDYFQTQRAIKLVKDTFERRLSGKLSLIRVTAPRFLAAGTGLQDDLAGTQVPVSFSTRFAEKVEMVHSLAKWKRHVLGKHGFSPGSGIYTDMDAVRKDEDISEIHSVYVDQWDWEKVISRDQRTHGFLKETVSKIYEAIIETEFVVEREFPALAARLPKSIHPISAQELEDMYPDATPGQREHRIAERFGAVFIRGIGHPLRSGKPHDLRASDYDEWELCGDIIVWDPVRESALELSSMGIRVDSHSLVRQLEHTGQAERKALEFHKSVIEGRVPLTIGGGIGQSRLCMLLLQKAHIGEVQSSAWPEEVEKELEKRGVALL